MAEELQTLDVSISYPGYIESLHDPLSRLAHEIREKAGDKEIDRNEQIERIARFYGFTEQTVVAVPSAGEALHTLLQYFTDQGDQVLIPEGSYARFPNFVESLAGGARIPRWVDAQELGKWVNDGQGNMGQTVVLVEEPRTPAYTTPDPDVYPLTAVAGKFRAIIYDGVSWGFDTDTSVVREGTENRLRRAHPFPMAEARMRAISASKILPTDRLENSFPNVGVIALSNSVDSRALEQLKKGIPRKHYQSPSNANLYTMAEILHSERFPEFIADMRALAKRNTDYLRDTLVAQIIPDGANVFVGFQLPHDAMTPENIGAQLKALGLNALYSQLYFKKSKEQYYTRIRVPIIMNQPNLEKMAGSIKERLEYIHNMFDSIGGEFPP